MDRQQRTNFRIGLIIAISIAIVCLNMVAYPEQEQENSAQEQEEEIEVVVIPRTVEQKRVPPPPAIRTSFLDTPDIPEFIEEEPPAKTEPIIGKTEEAKEVITNAPPRPEPPKAPSEVKPKYEPEDIGFVMIAEKMPTYGDCHEQDLSKDEITQCSNKALLSYLYNNIKYPALARENGISGTVVVQFIIGKNGQVRDIEVVKDIGGGCGQETLRVLRKMEEWQPGKQRGMPVNVKMTLPVKFNLE